MLELLASRRKWTRYKEARIKEILERRRKEESRGGRVGRGQ
jgi:hypothetical protein